ncbi:hypothetical protein BX266_7249 [Streptomyces sp. TLI_171]|nr:hypothetical protein BX266_7249 [Streptomyces sp. TLI_171]
MVTVGVKVSRVDACAQHLKRLAMREHDALSTQTVHEYELVSWVAIMVDHMRTLPYAAFAGPLRRALATT